MAEYTVLEIITAKAPQYITDPADLRIEIFSDLADQMLTQCITGNNRNYAIALQVLHWLVMADRNSGEAGAGSDGNEASIGAVTKRKEGELEIWYGTADGAAPKSGTDLSQELKQTPYGLELYSFLKRFAVYAYTRQVGTCGKRTPTYSSL